MIQPQSPVAQTAAIHRKLVSNSFRKKKKKKVKCLLRPARTYVAVAVVKHVSERGGDIDHVTSGGVDHAFGRARGAGGVEHKQRVFRAHPHALPRGRLARHNVAPQHVGRAEAFCALFCVLFCALFRTVFCGTICVAVAVVRVGDEHRRHRHARVLRDGDGVIDHVFERLRVGAPPGGEARDNHGRRAVHDALRGATQAASTNDFGWKTSVVHQSEASCICAPAPALPR